MSFSIILPTYNRASMISNAIESVLSQSFKDWELIIIDDGSTDNTKEKVQKYEKLDKRIKYIYQNNLERSTARNNGIKKAKNNWICFLDSDDIYHSSHLMIFCKLIKENNYEKGLYFSGVSINKYDSTLQDYETSGKSDLEFVVLNTLGTPRACCSNEILKANQFNPKIQIGEDKELWCRIVKKHSLFYHRNKTFVEVDHGKRSINQDLGFLNLKTLRYIFKIHHFQKKFKSKILSEAYFFIAKKYIIINSKFNAILYLSLSIFINFRHKKNKHKFLLIFALLNIYNNNILKEYKPKKYL